MPDLDHLFDQSGAVPQRHKPTDVGRDSEFDLPPRPDQAAHGSKLQLDIEAAKKLPETEISEPPPNGLTLTFESEDNFGLRLKSLDLRGSDIQLLSVAQVGAKQIANVFVPDGKLKEFEKRVTEYLQVDPNDPEKIKNKKLVESISGIRRAAARALFTDAPNRFPSDEARLVWWEVWLRTSAVFDEAKQDVDNFVDRAKQLGFSVRSELTFFPERAVFMVRCSVADWARSNVLLTQLAELRRGRTLATEMVTLPAVDQREWIDDLLSRLAVAPKSAPSVLLIDSGVNREHPLLVDSLAKTDWHAVYSAWSKADKDPQQHGTAMAGLAVFGCLSNVFERNDQVELRHRLESTRLYRPDKPHDRRNWGALTNVAVRRAALAAPNRQRVVCLALTADTDADLGAPSSWSGAIDARAAGVLASDRVLFVISAGNAATAKGGNLKKRGGIQEPAQARNALTVGAMTEIGHPTTKHYRGWKSVGVPDGLSPWSRTALPWNWDGHPFKPDIVLEGGNGAVQKPGDEPDLIDDVALLSTMTHPSGRLLTTFGMTSAAAAEAARLAARTMARYPAYWPETIRGLMTHAARWTDQMKTESTVDGKLKKNRLLGCFGWGTPTEENLIASAENRATLVIEDSLRPYQKVKSDIEYNEVNFHRLPWPTSLLQSLGSQDVSVRITLSYFIEPSPGRLGWADRFRYPSHGLRFHLQHPDETDIGFKHRVTSATWPNPKKKPSVVSDSKRWTLGTKKRNRGCLIQDEWTGTGAELATCGQIAVFPVLGWWKTRKHLNRFDDNARYSLIVSLRTKPTLNGLQLYESCKTLLPIAIEN